MAERPAMVVCMDHTSGESLPITSIKELPAQSTVKDLASMLEIPLGSHVLVHPPPPPPPSPFPPPPPPSPLFSPHFHFQPLSKLNETSNLNEA